uniref:Uncharacterized protein n=1 Tax=Castor canadensis TaxID=51338 RepID=A0A8C0XPL9_CASCN
MWRLVSSLFKALKTPLPALGWDSASLMDINNLLALVEDIVCLQNMARQGFWEESKKTEDSFALTLGTMHVKKKTQHLKPKLAQSGSWKDSTYRQCLYLQLECMEQELQLVGPRGFPKHHSHAQALRQLQTLKSCLRGQPGLLPPACAR